MCRYVILEHDHPHLHWDLMVEWGDRLKTWRLSAPPGERETISAEALQDHRLMYLDYEGPVSGGRGQVTRWDEGSVVARSDGDVWTFAVQGRRLRGVIRLTATTEHGLVCIYSEAASER